MRKELFIRLMPEVTPVADGDTALRASWVLREDNRFDYRVFQGDLKDAAAQAAGARVTVLVPSINVLLAQVNLPNLKSQKLAKAAPFALEDQLADEVEDLHVALGERDLEGRVANAVVDRTVLDGWLRQLREAGLHPDVVSPELFGVSWSPEAGEAGWSLVLDQDRALLRTERQMGLGFDMENAGAVLRAALEGAGDNLPARMTVTVCESPGFDDAVSRELSELCAQQGVTLAVQHTDSPCASLLASGFNEQNAINLLQGDYSLKGQLQKLLLPWRAALILLGCWLVLQFGLVGAEYAQLSRQQAVLQAEITQVFQQTFPDKRLVAGAERELIQRGLAELRGGGGGGGDLLDLLARGGEVVKAEPGVRVRSLRYKESTLDVDLELPDLQVLDRLKLALAEAGLAVNIISASARDGKVESRLTLQSAAGGGK